MMVTYIAQRKENFTRSVGLVGLRTLSKVGDPVAKVRKCGVSILTDQKVSKHFLKYFGMSRYSLFDTVAKLYYYLILRNAPGTLWIL